MQIKGYKIYVKGFRFFSLVNQQLTQTVKMPANAQTLLGFTIATKNTVNCVLTVVLNNERLIDAVNIETANVQQGGAILRRIVSTVRPLSGSDELTVTLANIDGKNPIYLHAHYIPAK